MMTQLAKLVGGHGSEGGGIFFPPQARVGREGNGRARLGRQLGHLLHAEQLAKAPSHAWRVEDTWRQRPATVAHPRSERLNEDNMVTDRATLSMIIS
jgi:hypothetical protein